MNSTATKAEKADNGGKAESLGRQSDSDISDCDGPVRGYHPKVKSNAENQQKFRGEDNVRVRGQAISVIYKIKSVRQDPNTKVWTYKLEDKDGDIYEGSKAKNGYVAQRDLKAEG